MADRNNRELFSTIASILDEGIVYTARNQNEKIELRRGQKRTGLVHIILRRYEEKTLNKKIRLAPNQAIKEITARSFLIANSLDKSTLKQTPKGNWEIDFLGIQSIITKDKNGKFVLTRYELNDEKEVARNSINAVIAKYGNTPEFLDVYAQVGAVLTSYGYNITQNQNLSTKTQENSHPAQGIQLSNENGTAQLFNKVVNLTAKNIELENKVQELTKQLEKAKQQKQKQKSKDDDLGRS